MTFKMDLRMKATLLVGFITYVMQHPSSMNMVENLFSSMVQVRNEEGRLTVAGKRLHSLLFMLVTYMVMSRGRR